MTCLKDMSVKELYKNRWRKAYFLNPWAKEGEILSSRIRRIIDYPVCHFRLIVERSFTTKQEAEKHLKKGKTDD